MILSTLSTTISLQHDHDQAPYVLLVDDDCDDCDVFMETIKEGWPHLSVTCFNYSERVMDFLSKAPANALPSLMVFDYNMPKITGVELVKKVKEDFRFAHIPVAVYSHSSYSRHREESLAAGACIFLSKSSSLESIKEDVKELLSYCL